MKHNPHPLNTRIQHLTLSISYEKDFTSLLWTLGFNIWLYQFRMKKISQVSSEHSDSTSDFINFVWKRFPKFHLHQLHQFHSRKLHQFRLKRFHQSCSQTLHQFHSRKLHQFPFERDIAHCMWTNVTFSRIQSPTSLSSVKLITESFNLVFRT